MFSMTKRTEAARIIPALGAVLVFAFACSTDEKKSAPSEPVSGESKAEKSEIEASSNRVTLTNSLSNNPLTAETISSAKAEQEAERYKGAKDKRGLESRISAERLARKGAGELMASAKRLAELEIEKGAGHSISPEVKLDIALAALQTRNFALAEYYLQELTDVKIPKIKAGAYNALGVVALRDDRVPEAVLYFKEALKASAGYKPALLNLGFAALKGGDLGQARSALGGMQNDWFVQLGLITVARLEGNDAKAGDLCDSVLKQEPGHIAALYNCALFEYQNRHNVQKAKELVTRAQKAKADPAWTERAFQLSATIDAEEAQLKREQARQKAEKAAAETKMAPKAGASGQSGGSPPSQPAKQ